MRLNLRALAFLGLGWIFAGCSLLAPGDDEYLGGSGSSGTGAGPAGGSGGAVDASAGGTAATESGGTGATAGGSGGTGAAPTGGTGAAPAGGSAGTDGGSTGGSGGAAGGDACSPSAMKATPHPVALYLMLDHSSTVTSSGDWDNVVTPALTAFVDAATSAGVEVGIQFWPLSNGTCAGAGYGTPAVSIAALPGNATAVKNAIATPPVTGTSDPLDGVINGGVSVCKGLMNNVPGTQCKLVLISDWSGTNACPSTLTELSTLVANARTTEPSVTTHAIRLSLSGTSALTQLAQAGGTGSAYAGTANALENLLGRVATPCHYDLPFGSSTGVSWALNGQTLTEVANASACSTGNSLQYYMTLKTMVLCPGTCAAPGFGSSPTVTATLSCSP